MFNPFKLSKKDNTIKRIEELFRVFNIRLQEGTDKDDAIIELWGDVK